MSGVGWQGLGGVEEEIGLGDGLGLFPCAQTCGGVAGGAGDDAGLGDVTGAPEVGHGPVGVGGGLGERVDRGELAEVDHGGADGEASVRPGRSMT